MANYTHLNLAALENVSPKFGITGMEFRGARDALGLERSGLSYQRLGPGFRVPFSHHHATQEEVYVVLSGSARLKLEDEILELGPLDAVRVGPGVERNFEGGPEGAEVLAFGAPQVGPDDSPMTQNWWQD